MTPRRAALAAAWVLLAVAGWATGSTALIVIAPLPLLGIPVVMALDRRRQERFDPLEPIWPLSALFGFTYVLVPALAVLEPPSFTSLPGYLDSPPEQRQMAGWLGALALLSLLAGYASGLGPRLVARLRVRETAERPVFALATALALFGLGSAAVVATIVINDGFRLPPYELLTGQIRGEAVASFTGRGYLSVGWALLSLSGPCAAVWSAMAGGGVRRWTIVAVIAGVSVVLLAGVLGSRLFGLAIPVGVLVVVHYRVRPVPLRLVAAAAVAVLGLALFQLTFRGAAEVNGLLSALGGLSVTLDGFIMLANALGRVHDFLYGQSVGEDAFLAYVPRALWEDKPTFYGFIRAQELVVPGMFDDIRRGATFPIGIVAEGYVNFAVPGALAFPFLAGVVYRALYVRLRRAPSPYVLAIAAWAIPNTLSLMRSLGPMIPAAGIAIVFLSPLLLARRRA